MAKNLKKWLDDTRLDLKEALDERLNALWERAVIAPLMQLTEEHEPEDHPAQNADNIIELRSAVSA